MKFQTITLSEVQNSELLTERAKTWALNNLDYLNKPMTLLGSSLKVEKGEKLGFYTNVLYLMPANSISKKTLCAGAKVSGCLDGCLINSGLLAMKTGQNAAIKRTILFTMRKQVFLDSLVIEIKNKHKKYGDKLAIRLNGTSDINFAEVYKQLPHVQFYEYTKLLSNTKHSLKNVHFTYSGSAFNARALKNTAQAIRDGLSVALAFNTKETKGDSFSIPHGLTSFDDTDLRFLDEAGTVGALKRKGGNIETRKKEYNEPNFFFTDKSYNNLIELVNL